MKQEELEEDGFWEEETFAETMSAAEMKEKMKTFHKKHDEDMFFNCKKCNKNISAHNKDWHAGLCDDCFDKYLHSSGNSGKRQKRGKQLTLSKSL